ELTGVVRGIQIAMTATFDEDGGSFELTQAGQTATFELASEEPLYVLDNNFLDGFQVIAYEALRRGEPIDVAAVVPQSGALGRVTAQLRSEPEPVNAGDATVQAFGLDIVLTVGPQAIEAVAWLDADGTIVALDQPAGNIRFLKVSTGGAAPEDEEPATEATETASELLERTATCVETMGVNVDSTGANLYGLLSLPVDRPKEGAPTLVLLPGSGPTDVAGNSLPLVTNSGYEQLANLLGCQGYGVLRVAKLGIPPSTGDANAVTLQTYAQNTADWFALLAETDGVDANRLGVIGHSEGGLIALYAVANGYIEPDVVVLLATAGRPLGALLREQVIASAERGGLDEAAVAVYAADVDELLDAVRESEGPALEITGGLEDNQLAPAFAAAAGLLRSEIDVDPLELAQKVTVPTIVVQGLKDVQVRQVDGRLLANALPNVLHLELPDLTHTLVETRLPAEAMLLPAGDAVISETMVRSLATFLHGTLRLAR
ncbi:MAG TPA: alpha/beta fold hydrolase, partial [Trueperaceae bacterium]